MIQTVKWILPLCLFIGAIPAGAQATVAGYTTLDYDAQSNTMIGTCTISPSYAVQAYYNTYTACTVENSNPADYGLTDGVTSGATSATYEFTPVNGDTYTIVGNYGLYFVYETVYFDIYTYEYTISSWDPYDFSSFADDNYPPDDVIWSSGWEPVVLTDIVVTQLGNVPSQWISVRTAVTTYALQTVNANGTVTFIQACPGTSTATCGAANHLGSEPAIWAEEFQIYLKIGGQSGGMCFPLGLIQYFNGPPAPYPCT